MTDETELHELKERIAKLRLTDQLHLFEMVLADYRRQREEAIASMQAANAAYLAREKLLQAAADPLAVPPEAKREAG